MEMKRLCETCAHDGQCDGLPYCDGRYYEKYSEVYSDEEEDADAVDEEEDENRDEPRYGYSEDALARAERNLP